MDTGQRITKRLNEIEEERRRIIRLMEMTSITAEGETLHERLAELQQERRELEARLRAMPTVR
jgi:hypothetical protein